MSSSINSILSKTYHSFEEMEMDVERAASNDHFIVVKKNTSYSSERVVLKGCFRCYKSGTSMARTRGTAKTDCPFKLNFRRRAADGNYFFTENHKFIHNHIMDADSITMAAGARQFAPDQLATINDLRSTGAPVSQILEKLRDQTNAIIQKKDVFNALQRAQRIRFTGLSETQNLLSALQGNVYFVFDTNLNSRNQLAWLTFASRSSLERFSEMSFVLLMDTTYGTNRFDMPLLIFSSYDNTGSPYILACALMRNETFGSYAAVLESFKRLFGSTPPVVHTIMTDQDPSLIRAINAQFPNSAHQLCRWHLEKNVLKRIPEKPSIRSKFAQFMHSSCEISADRIYAEMLEDCSDDEATYFSRIYAFKQKFLEAHVSKNLNLGIRSSQSAESMNSSFKSLLQTASPLVDLFHAMEHLSKRYEDTLAFKSFQRRDKQKFHHPIITPLTGKISDFILDMMESECSKLNLIKLIETTDECFHFDDLYEVSYNENRCNCPFFCQFAAPCVHAMLCLGRLDPEIFPPAWRIKEAIVAEPAILHGPMQDPRLLTDKNRAELLALVTDAQSRLLGMDTNLALVFVKKLHEMMDGGDFSGLPQIQDPPIQRSRGRPRKTRKKKNTFRGGKDIA